MSDRDFLDGRIVTSTSTGTGTMAIGSAEEGYGTIPDGFDGDVRISMGANYESCRATVSGTTLTRVTVYESSNSGSKVDWGAGTKYIAAVTSADALNKLATQVAGINNQSGTAYTPVLADAGKAIRLENANAIALTIPKNDTVDFPIGTLLHPAQIGAGQITVAGAADVTVNFDKKSAGQGAYMTLIKVAANIWDCIGGIE